MLFLHLNPYRHQTLSFYFYGPQRIRLLLISFQGANWLLNECGSSYFNINPTSAIPTSLHGSFQKLDIDSEQNMWVLFCAFLSILLFQNLWSTHYPTCTLFWKWPHCTLTLRPMWPQIVEDDVATTTALEILDSFIASLVLVTKMQMLDFLISSWCSRHNIRSSVMFMKVRSPYQLLSPTNYQEIPKQLDTS
jgi:hypothetical protein